VRLHVRTTSGPCHIYAQPGNVLSLVWHHIRPVVPVSCVAAKTAAITQGKTRVTDQLTGLPAKFLATFTACHLPGVLLMFDLHQHSAEYRFGFTVGVTASGLCLIMLSADCRTCHFVRVLLDWCLFMMYSNAHCTCSTLVAGNGIVLFTCTHYVVHHFTDIHEFKFIVLCIENPLYSVDGIYFSFNRKY